jgi:DNA polymerase
MAQDLSYHDALAALAWQVELGADEALLDHPVDRFDLPEPVPAAAAPKLATPPITAAAPVRAAVPDVDTVAIARQLAEAAGSLDTLRAAMEGFEHCELKRGARNFVFSDGQPSARVMVVGEAPGREEDERGKPFVGAAGQLLDKMFAAIGLDRSVEGANGLYITNMLPWRPPQNRDPKPEELAMMMPFVHRHIELARPEVLVLMGNHACAGLLGRRGITKMRGNWEAVQGVAAMPMFHPAYLLRTPVAKREAWADLLAIKARLEGSA